LLFFNTIQFAVFRGETVAFLKKALQKTLHKGLAENNKAKGGAKAKLLWLRHRRCPSLKRGRNTKMNELILVFLPLFRAFLPFSYRCLLKVPLVLSFQGKNGKIPSSPRKT